MAKIKTTKNGNIQITISPKQAEAIRSIVGRSNTIERMKMVDRFTHCPPWTAEEDERLVEVYRLITDFTEGW